VKHAALSASILVACAVSCSEPTPSMPSAKGVETPAPPRTAPAQPATSATTWRSNDGVLSSELPKRWTIASAEPGRVLVNPGLKESDTLDCLLVIVWGELEPSQHQLDAVSIMQQQETALRNELRGQQVLLQAPRERPTPVAVGTQMGAELMFEGTAAGNAVRTWVGTTLHAGWHATVVAVMVQGQEGRFLPQVRQMLTSMRIQAPQRDAQLEALLLNREYQGSTSFGSGGAIHVTYRFEAQGVVVRTSLVSGSFGIDGAVGGETKRRGTWTSQADSLTLRFDDGPEQARVQRRGARVDALHIGANRYTPR